MVAFKKTVIRFFLVAAFVLSLSLPSFSDGARSVILMIGDGMGPAQIHAYWLYSSRFFGKPSAMVEIMKQGTTGYVHCEPLDSIAPESASSGTQIATGIMVRKGTIGVGLDGKPIKSILEYVRDKGRATGLVTTSFLTDATPAAFFAHVNSRRDVPTIAKQMIEANIDVLLGGGRSVGLSPTKVGSREGDNGTLIEAAALRGYEVAFSAREMEKASGKRLLGLFSDGEMAYERDRYRTGEPSLAEMTRRALHVLGSRGEGFFLMVEGGRIDHAAHRNDINTLVGELMAFDDAVRVAHEYQMKHPDTLLIITGDHDTAGLALVSPDGENGGVRNDRIPGDPSMLNNHARWATRSHTATPVFVWGIGPGSERLNGWLHATDIFKVMILAYGFQ